MPQQNHGLQTFEYHFKFFQLYHNYFSFISLGWENWKYPQKYSIDNFGSSENQFIFQYTVSGEGAITINSHTHVLRPGQAFLIERPGATHYSAAFSGISSTNTEISTRFRLPARF